MPYKATRLTTEKLWHLRCFLKKNFCQGNSDQCYNVNVDFLFTLPLFYFLKINNIEMKSHLGP